MASSVSNFTLEGLDRFRVERPLGRGGFGEVFKAWDHELERHVAIKLLSQYDPQAHLQLAGEFSRVQSIKHPNLVELYELLYIRRRPVLLMEYLPDAVSFPSGVRDDIWDRDADVAMSMTTIAATRRLLLEEELEQPRSTPLPATHHQRFFDAGLGLLFGLDALHQRGLVHRDIKPSNVVLAEGRTVILDYGLTMEDGGELLELAGTAGYIAPELLGGGRATKLCDVYSVGMLFARALLGRLPSSRERATGLDLYADFLTDGPSDAFFELLTRTTSKDPAERPGVAELIDAMQNTGECGTSSRAPEIYTASGQAETVGSISSRLANNLCILRGPVGSGRTTIVNDVLKRWSKDQDGHQVFRVDAASESYDRLVTRIVHTGAERLMGFADRDDVPVRGLRISNQLASQFPVIEAALENLGMPRQLGAAPAELTANRQPQLLAQWLRALYHQTPWVVVIEHIDPTDEDIVGFLATLFQQGEFPQCGGALVTSTFRLDVLDELPNALSFDCHSLSGAEIETLLRSKDVALGEADVPRAVELLKSLTRGFLFPINQLIEHLPTASTESPDSTANDADDCIREALSNVIGSLDPVGVAALWVICAARSSVRREWLQIICSPEEDIDPTLQRLIDRYLVDRSLFEDGTIGFVPYSPELSRVFLDYVSASTFPVDGSVARLDALSSASISGTHLVARLYATFGSDLAASDAYRRCIRLLLRSHRYDQALKVCEEFMGHRGLEFEDYKAIASVFIHCRRPLEAAIHMERFATQPDCELARLARRIRTMAGDSRGRTRLEERSTHTVDRSARTSRTPAAIATSISDLYQRLKNDIVAASKPEAPTLYEDFREVHPSLESTYRLFRESRWHRCIEAATSDRWVDLDDPAPLVPLIRLHDYVIARSQFYINRSLTERIVANPEGSQLLLGNHRFQTAVSYLNVGWLLGLQSGSVLDVVRRVERCGEILEEYQSGPDLLRLLYEARSARRILYGCSEAEDIIAWPQFTSELVSTYLQSFFDARDAADERKAREILREGFRRSYHGGSKLIASVLLMVFGQYTEERLMAEQSLQASGWQIPDIAACLLLGLSREDLYELRAEISAVEGIHLPSQTTFDIRSFVGARRTRS